MKISHIAPEHRPSSIIVRNYDNEKIVHVPNYIITECFKKSPDEIGRFKIKYKEVVEIIVFDKL